MQKLEDAEKALKYAREQLGEDTKTDIMKAAVHISAGIQDLEDAVDLLTEVSREALDQVQS